MKLSASEQDSRNLNAWIKSYIENEIIPQKNFDFVEIENNNTHLIWGKFGEFHLKLTINRDQNRRFLNVIYELNLLNESILGCNDFDGLQLAKVNISDSIDKFSEKIRNIALFGYCREDFSVSDRGCIIIRYIIDFDDEKNLRDAIDILIL